MNGLRRHCAKKVARRPPDQDEKPNETKCREAAVYRQPRHAGGYRRARLHKPSVEPRIHLSKSTGATRRPSQINGQDRFEADLVLSINSRNGAVPRRRRRGSPSLARGHEAVLTSCDRGRPRTHSKLSLRKEVIQPQVPLRLPCYDLVPVTEPGVGTSESRRLRPFPAPMT